MASLKDLKIRIESVKSTRKITKAMQMVAAAKLRRAQEAAENARPYSERLRTLMSDLAASMQDGTAPPALVGTERESVHLLIAATAERGLCGGFNTSIARLVRHRASALLADGGTVKILTIGKKGREQLKRDFASAMIGHVDLSAHRRVPYSAAMDIAQDVLRRFADDEFDTARIFYSRFQSVITQEPTERLLVPMIGETGETSGTRHEYEPDEGAILDELMPLAVASQIFSALLENAASEQGARMSAMDNATRNAGEMIDKLTIVYNRSRQAAITEELIEIISGAEAL